MPRNQERKTDKGNFHEDDMRRGVELVLAGRSRRSVARELNLSFQTLSRYVAKQKDNPEAEIRMKPNYEVNKVFTVDQEEQLVEYLTVSSRMFYGLPKKECRKLAYEMAVRNGLKHPKNWDENREAGIDWMFGFMKRHPRLSLRTPEGCSLARATSFNPHNVNAFFDNLAKVLKRHPTFADGTRIYNLDETSTTTVQKSPKIIAPKGIKQVSKVTSGEKGTLVTSCIIVNAAGNTLPPAMVFPRVHFKQIMITGAPSGTLGLAHKSGWMTCELFVQVMQHFIKHTQSSLQNPTLLIYDNHESHLSLEVIELAKSNGVTILTIPPHCSQKLQPLDVGVFKPFMGIYDACVDSWLMHNPGEPFTIYQVAACVGEAQKKGATPSNIIAAFKKCGIFPYDRHVFSEADFLCSSVTDRPQVTNGIEREASEEEQAAEGEQAPGPSSRSPASPPLSQPEDDSQSIDMTVVSATNSSSTSGQQNVAERHFISPKDIRGYPKAKERKQTQKRRRKGKSIIATDTPEKEEIEKRNEMKKNKVKAVKRKVLNDRSEDMDHAVESRNKKVKKPKKQKVVETSSDEESEISLMDSSGDENFIPQPQPSGFEELERSPEEGDFVLQKFAQEKKKDVFYIAKVLKKDANDYFVKYLRKSVKLAAKFIFPPVDDTSFVSKTDIVMILPPPTVHGTTKRQHSYFSFEIDFRYLEIR